MLNHDFQFGLGTIVGIATLLVSIAVPCLAEEELEIVIDGRLTPLRGFVIEGTAFVSLRDIAEALGCQVQATSLRGYAGHPPTVVVDIITTNLLTSQQSERPAAAVDALAPEDTKWFAPIGDGYAVRGLNFKPYAHGLATKILGELRIPAFEPTRKPVHVDLSLVALDKEGKIVGSAPIHIRSLPSSGGIIPFEEVLTQVEASEIAYVRITRKGAWTYGKD